MRWFGPAPFSRLCDEVPHVPTPVGAPCVYCEEPIAPDERGYFYVGAPPPPVHYECFVRQIVGSVAHQQHRCSCYGGHDEDPPELSRRAAAKLALLAFEGRGS